MKMRLSEFIRKAKDTISSPSRWTQGRLHGVGTHCALGALEAAAGQFSYGYFPEMATSEMKATTELIHEVIEGHEKWRSRVRSTESHYRVTASFNDNHLTTHEEVMQLFEESARRAELKENEANHTNIEPAVTTNH